MAYGNSSSTISPNDKAILIFPLRRLEVAEMARKAFAFRFECDITLDEIVSRLNDAGPWKWQARESYWYGDYLNCRPANGARIRIHDHGQSQPPRFQQQSRPDYTMQVDIDTEHDVEASRFVEPAKELLVKIGARNILGIESYD